MPKGRSSRWLDKTKTWVEEHREVLDGLRVILELVKTISNWE